MGGLSGPMSRRVERHLLKRINMALKQVFAQSRADTYAGVLPSANNTLDVHCGEYDQIDSNSVDVNNTKEQIPRRGRIAGKLLFQSEMLGYFESRRVRIWERVVSRR